MLLLALFSIFYSCRKGDFIVGSTTTQVTDSVKGDIKGFFLLNEGNMGSNKSTLDYYDYTTGEFHKNIYAERNPSIVKELGDVGNDIAIWGGKIYAVINCSHFIEVMDAKDATHIAKISIPNCRFIKFKDNYAYVSSYAGPVKLDPNARLGYVAKVDTASLEVVDTCVVGYQPDQMVIVDDKIYVANSGGYRVPNYDSTVSVIDINTFKEIKKIDVAINLSGMQLDSDGNIWVSSRGDYYDVPSKTFVIDPQTDKVTHTFDLLPNSNMVIAGDSLYVIATQYSKVTESNSISYAIVNTKTKKVVTRKFLSDDVSGRIRIPYGVAIDPKTRDIYITDAADYITPGTLYCCDKNGNYKWSVMTGDIPASFAFAYTKLQAVE